MTKTTDKMSKEVKKVLSRGCEYLFEHYEDKGVVVCCWNKDEKLIWDGCTSWDDNDRIVDVIRSAKENGSL